KARGSSLRKASPIAGTTSVGENIEVGLAWAMMREPSEELAGGGGEVIGDRAERQAGEEGEPADDQDDPDEQPDPQSAGGGEGARAGRRVLLRREAASDRQHGDDDEETTDPHRDAEQGIVERRPRGEPGEGRAVVRGGGGAGVEDLRKAVRPLVERPGDPRLRHRG